MRIVPPCHKWDGVGTSVPLVTFGENEKGGAMDSGVLAAVITSVVGLIGIIVTNVMSNKEIEHKLAVNQAITDTKLDNLTQEVKSHNSNVQQIPVLQEKINNLEIRLEHLEQA